MTEGRTQVVYVTNDGTGRWLRLDLPGGLISPPVIELHVPLAGPAVFYHAESYRLPVPEEARS